jgi:dTDP-4-dehydrorhamnose 3,5-epimerase
MHFQIPPSNEAKLVRCLKGRIHDVIIDLRPRSATYLQNLSIDLDAESRVGLFVPAGFAHGFQSLTDDAEVLYQMTDFYDPELSFGFRWNDPALGIDWPLPETVLSERDNRFSNFDPELISGFSDLA